MLWVQMECSFSWAFSFIEWSLSNGTNWQFYETGQPPTGWLCSRWKQENHSSSIFQKHWMKTSCIRWIPSWKSLRHGPIAEHQILESEEWTDEWSGGQVVHWPSEQSTAFFMLIQSYGNFHIFCVQSRHFSLRLTPDTAKMRTLCLPSYTN